MYFSQSSVVEQISGTFFSQSSVSEQIIQLIHELAVIIIDSLLSIYPPTPLSYLRLTSRKTLKLPLDFNRHAVMDSFTYL